MDIQRHKMPSVNKHLKNKKSFLSFQFLLKQEKDRVLKLKDIKKEALETINKIVGSLENSILEHDFSIYKNKNS